MGEATDKRLMSRGMEDIPDPGGLVAVEFTFPVNLGAWSLWNPVKAIGADQEKGQCLTSLVRLKNPD